MMLSRIRWCHHQLRKLHSTTSCSSVVGGGAETHRVRKSGQLSVESRLDDDMPLYGEEPVLMRDFVKYALYDKDIGFFNRVDRIKRYPPIDFSELSSTLEFHEVVNERYRSTTFLTPVEVFQPWYGQAVAEWIVRLYLEKYSSSGHDLHVYEVGGAKGTCALNILDHLREKFPDVYAKTHYCNVEHSDHHVNNQHEELSALHSSKYRVVNENFVETQLSCSEPCFVFGLEVLDNMPHDKVIRRGNNIYQTMVVRHPSHNVLIEAYGSVSDETILETMEAFMPLSLRQRFRLFRGRGASVESLMITLTSVLSLLDTVVGDREFWLPTTCVQFLKRVQANFPRHELLLMDFDFLPGDVLTGENGPLVQTRTGRSHNTVLRDVGASDIFFPTNFYQLANLYRTLCGNRDSIVMSNREFTTTFGETQHTVIRNKKSWLKREANPFTDMYQQNTTVFMSSTQTSSNNDST